MSLKGISETSFQDRLAKYVESGDITQADYEKLIERHGDAHRKNKVWGKNKIKKIAYATLSIILALLLASVSVLYHNYATEKAYNKGYGYYKNVMDEYKFFNKHAVIVTTTGKKYHRYDCYHINGEELCIYDTESAEAKGYTACSDCIVKTKSQLALEKLREKYGLTGKYKKKIKKE